MRGPETGTYVECEDGHRGMIDPFLDYLPMGVGKCVRRDVGEFEYIAGDRQMRL